LFGAAFVTESYYWWSRQSNVRIIQITSIAQVQNFLDTEILSKPGMAKKTLVFFDLDNTLVEPTTPLASDQWFDACMRYYQDKGLSLQQANKIVLPMWKELFLHVHVKPVEPMTIAVLDAIAKKVSVLAVTARSQYSLAFKQLAEVGISFQQNPLAQHMFLYNQFRFERGILFCNGADKGAAVAALLQQLLLKPKLIVMVDDKIKNLESVAKIVVQQKIDFVGFRYGFLDEKVKNFQLDQETMALLDVKFASEVASA
jgi:hypothetical protein